MPDYRSMAVLDLLLLRIQNAHKLLEEIRAELSSDDDKLRMDHAIIILLTKENAIKNELKEKEGMR